MRVKLTRYSKPGNTRRKQDQTAAVEWTVTVTKNGYINIEIETGHVYTVRVNNEVLNVKK